MTHQELKDILWQLDEAAIHSAARITERTGQAWSAAVEHEPYRNHMLEAQREARALYDRICREIDRLGA